MKGKWELLPKIEEITVDRHTNTHMEKKSKYFDGHVHPSQSEESKCMWAHDKDGVTRSVLTYIHSLLIEKDGRVRWNISILFPCACPPWSVQFLARILTFFSLILCFTLLKFCSLVLKYVPSLWPTPNNSCNLFSLIEIVAPLF